MYMPGRLRTGSRPSRIVMSLALYSPPFASVFFELMFYSEKCSSRPWSGPEGRRRAQLWWHDLDELAALHHLVTADSTACESEVLFGHFVLAAEGGLDDDPLVLARGDHGSESPLIALELHERDALAGSADE